MKYYIFYFIFIVIISFYIFADEGTGGGGEGSSNKTLSLSYLYTDENYAFLTGQVTYQTNITEFISLDISTSLGKNISLQEQYPRDNKSFNIMSSYLPQSWWSMNVGFGYNRTHNERTENGKLNFLAHSMMTNVSPDIRINVSDNLSTNIDLNLSHSSFAAKNPMTNLEARYSTAKNLYGSVSYKYTPTTTLTFYYGLNRENGWDYGYQYQDQFIDTKKEKLPFNLKGSNINVSINGNYTLSVSSSFTPSLNLTVSKNRDSKTHANDSDSIYGSMRLSASYNPKSAINISSDLSYYIKRDDFNNEEKKNKYIQNYFDYILTTLDYSGKAEFEISEKLTFSSQYSHESSNPKYYTESGQTPSPKSDISDSYFRSFTDNFNTSSNYMITDRLSIKIDHSLRFSKNEFIIDKKNDNTTMTNNLTSTLRFEYSDELTFTSDVRTGMTIVKYQIGTQYKNSNYGFGLTTMKSVGDVLQSIITYDIEQKLDFMGGSPKATGLYRSLITDITILPTGVFRPSIGFSIDWDVTPGSSELGNANILLYSLNTGISVVTSTNVNFSFSPTLGWQVSYYSKRRWEKTTIFQYNIDSDFSYQITDNLSTNVSISINYDRKPSLSFGFNYSF
ncbi:MAG: hypothetical protein ACUVWP_02650 [bacterium]